MPWWWQPHPSPCGGAARGSSTNAARPALRHSPGVLSGGTGLVGSEVCKRPATRREGKGGKPPGFVKCQLRWCIIDSGVRSNLRGGSWNNNSTNLGASRRFRNQPGDRNDNIGFRCARDVERNACKSSACRSRSGHGRFGRAFSTSGSRSRRGGSNRGVEHKSAPWPCGSESEAGPGSETGSAEKNSSGFAAKGKREKESREHFPSTTKPDAVVPVARLDPAAVRGPQERRIVAPRTAPKGAIFLRVVVPVGNPLPDITRQIRYPVGRRTSRKKPDRADPPKLRLIVVRPVGIGLLVAPRILAPLRAPRGPFPFRFCRQPHARPIAVSFRVEPSYSDDRTIVP